MHTDLGTVTVPPVSRARAQRPPAAAAAGQAATLCGMVCGGTGCTGFWASGTAVVAAAVTDGVGGCAAVAGGICCRGGAAAVAVAVAPVA